MKRSGELKRITPLARTTAMSRSPLARSALHHNSAANRRQPKRTTASRPSVPAKIRAALKERSGGLCEIGQQGCTGFATEFSHRKKVGLGGRKGAARVGHDVLSNALHGCHHCHSRHLHAEPTAAYAAGWMLREHQNPLAVPALYRGAWMFLADDGSVSPDPLIAEEAS